MKKLLKQILASSVKGFNLQILGRDFTPLKDTYSRLIEPNENKDFAFKKNTSKSMENLTVSEALRRMIKTNETLDAVVDIHQTFTVRDYSFTHDEKDGAAGEQAQEVIETFVENSFGGIKSLRGALKQMAYYRVVEGAIALRVVFNEETLEPKIEVLSPFSLVYLYVDRDGNEISKRNNNLTETKYAIIGKKIRSNEIEVYYDERRSDEENQTFVYLPANLRGDTVFGNSQLATLLQPAYDRQKLTQQLSDYLEKRIYPKVFYWINLMEMFKQVAIGNLNIKDVSNYVKDGAKALADKIKRSDDPESKQDVIPTAPIDYIEIAPASKTGLDGIEDILNAIEPSIQRASRVPRIMLGGQKGSVSLNDNESTTEMILFGMRTADASGDISTAVSRALIPIRRFLGVDPVVSVEVGNDNLIFQDILADILNKKSTAFDGLITSNVITAQEARMRLKDNNLDFSGLSDEIEITDIPQPTPEPAPEE